MLTKAWPRLFLSTIFAFLFGELKSFGCLLYLFEWYIFLFVSLVHVCYHYGALMKVGRHWSNMVHCPHYQGNGRWIFFGSHICQTLPQMLHFAFKCRHTSTHLMVCHVCFRAHQSFQIYLKCFFLLNRNKRSPKTFSSYHLTIDKIYGVVSNILLSSFPIDNHHRTLEKQVLKLPRLFEKMFSELLLDKTRNEV